MIRRLTPTECERLQGFPDNWTEGVSDTQRYKMMGNAVTTNVVFEVARRLI
jgi:DNA (cytosine-5)-methyltransferase 1